MCVCVCGHVRVYSPNSSTRAGCDTRSIFKRSITGLEFRVFFLLNRLSYQGEKAQSVQFAPSWREKLMDSWIFQGISAIWNKNRLIQVWTWVTMPFSTTITITLYIYGNYTRMLRAILNKSWQQHPTRHQLYGHLAPITKTIQVRRTRHAGHCWRSRDELIRDVLLWIPTHGRAKAGRPARTYIQQLCEDTGCCPEDLPRAMNEREEWRERVRDIRAASTIWWWWWYI